MRVRAVVNFTAFLEGDAREIRAGEALEMPEGKDWLRLGMVVPDLTPGPFPRREGERIERAVVTAMEKRKRRP